MGVNLAHICNFNCCSFYLFGAVEIPAGHRGVLLTFQAVTRQTLGEGLHFIIPGIQDIKVISVQTEAYETGAEAASKDLQDVESILVLNYHLQPERVNDIYQQLQYSWETRVIAPAVQETMKAITAKYNADELITNRQDVKDKLDAALSSRLALYGIEVDAVSITNFDFSESFNASIEAKVVAIQRAQEAENKLREIEAIAKQVEAEARGRANASIASATGEAQAAVMRADGAAKARAIDSESIAAANLRISASITDELIKYNTVDKLSSNVRVMIVPSGSGLILSPDLLTSVQPVTTNSK